MIGANSPVRAGQKFLFQCPAALTAWNSVTFTYDDTIRLKVQGAMGWAASDVAVAFETDIYHRAGYVMLKIAGTSRMDRAQGINIRDDCLSAAQAAGLVVNASQADINIYPANSTVNYSYNLPGGNGEAGMPSPATLAIIVVAVVVVGKILRG
jgi:hypothetical protein